MPRFYETTLSITNLHNLSISTHVNRSRIHSTLGCHNQRFFVIDPFHANLIRRIISPRGTIHRLIPLNKFKAIIPLIIFNGYPILYQSLVFLNLQHYQPLSSVYVSPSSLVGIGCKFNHAEKALSFSSLLTFRMPSLMYSAIRGRTSYSILFFNSSSSEAMK